MRLSFFDSNSLKIFASWVHARRRCRASVHSRADPTNPDRVEPSGKPDTSPLSALRSARRPERPIHDVMRTRDGRHRVRVSHEVIRATERGAAPDEKSLVLIQVPADRAVILASVSSALAGDDRRRDRRVGANNDPRVYVVPNWFRTV